MTVTPYADVNTVLVGLREGAVEALGAWLAGIYVTGSLAWGGYTPGASDIDALVATTGELPAETIEVLQSLHARLRESAPPLSHHMDVPYFTLAEVARTTELAGTHPMADSSVLRMVPHTREHLFDRHIARERGIVLYGPPPADIIAPVTAAQLRAAVVEQLHGPWARNLEPERADWLRPRQRQAFAALTMCRALHTLETGELMSKPDAAAWALRHLEARWHPLIGRAIDWRFDRTPDDLSETAAFICHTLQIAR